VVIELVPAAANEAVAKSRAERRVYLAERGYRVIDVAMADVEQDAMKVLDGVASAIGMPASFETAPARPPQDESKN
jgi:very-short-patch-repair endonuclease